MGLRRQVERLIAVGYGLTYDLTVAGFPPWEALLDEIAGLIAARAAEPARRADTAILDVACGTGTVALRLARDGYRVVGLDPVEHLVRVAEKRARSRSGPGPTFHHGDVARHPVPGGGSFDVVLSMHTLYWHPAPEALLEGCHRALKPGGHGVFLTYGRPARVGRTFREVMKRDGFAPAVRALRWLVPTAVFEALRDFTPRYLGREEFHRALERAGFEVLDSRETFLAGLSHLAWVRRSG